MIRPEGFCRPDVGICLRVLWKGLSKVIGGKGANVVARTRAPGREQNAPRLALWSVQCRTGLLVMELGRENL